MKKILIVDDSEWVLTSLRWMLQGASYWVLTASSGAEALRRLKSEPVDLVLTDIYMPAPDGLELLRLTQEMKLDVPFIAMSGHPAPLNMLLPAQLLGAQNTLQKPFSRDQLLATVAAALNRQPGRPAAAPRSPATNPHP